MHAPQLNYAREFRKRGVAIGWDTDDLLWDIPAGWSAADGGAAVREFHVKPETQATIRAFMELADTITVSTPELLEPLLAYGADAERLHSVPNALDLEAWSAAWQAKIWRLARAAAGEPEEWLTVGWFASQAHNIDAPLVIPALVALLERHPRSRVVLGGSAPGFDGMREALERFGGRVKRLGWLRPWEYSLALSELDLGLAPLAPCAFNACRSYVKWLELAAAGVACLAADSPVYGGVFEPGAEGLLVRGSTPEDWTAALLELADRPRPAGHLAQIGVAARARVERQYTADHTAPLWRRAYESGVRRRRAEG